MLRDVTDSYGNLLILHNNLDELFDRLRETLTHGAICVLYIDIDNFQLVEETYGKTVCNEILKALEQYLIECSATKLSQVIAVQHFSGDDYALYFGLDSELASSAILHRIQESVERLASQPLRFLLSDEIAVRLQVGFSIIRASENRSIESLLYSALKESFELAKSGDILSEISKALALEEVVESKKLETHLQPILHFHTGEAIGYEAFARGREGSAVEFPSSLFAIARIRNLVHEVDMICFLNALENSRNLLKVNSKLFINILPSTLISSPNFAATASLAVERAGLLPHNIIFELEVGDQIRNFAQLHSQLIPLRNEGFQIAIENAGAGYGSLEAIAELRPDFIKFDMSLLRGIDHNATKRTLLDTLVYMAGRFDSYVIAGSIEDHDELDTIRSLGIKMGQGFFIGSPARRPVISDHARQISKEQTDKTKGIDTIRSLYIERSSSMPPSTTGREAAHYFEHHPHASCIVIVTPNQQVVGLVMRQKFYELFGRAFGVPLYSKRTVESLMEKKPIIVDADAFIDVVARQTMERDSNQVYDAIVVVDDGKYIGTLAVHQLLEALTVQKVLEAKYANPLTGLPGNLRIKTELDAALSMPNTPLTVVHVDIDHFKAFNDKYGFTRGDDLIRWLGDLISGVVFECGTPSDFVGHIGGDDFVMVLGQDRVDIICETIADRFERGKGRHYDQEDIQAGYIEAYDRNHMLHSFPLVALSLAAIDLTSNCAPHFDRLLADTKKQAKLRKGTSFVRADPTA